MAKTRVVVKGGGKNLFYISETYGDYYVSTGSNNSVGKTKTFDQALSLIKNHSGKDIERIE